MLQEVHQLYPPGVVNVHGHTFPAKGTGRRSAQSTQSTLDTVNKLGLLYISHGKLAEAEQMYQRALQGKRKVQIKSHYMEYTCAGSINRRDLSVAFYC